MAVYSKLLELPKTTVDWLKSMCWSEGVPVSAWLLGGVLVLGSAAWLVATRQKLPPGPTGLPFIGIVGDFPSEPLHLECMRLRKQYKSDVISYRRMGRLYVVIHGYKLIREAFLTRGPDFSERPFVFPLVEAGFKDEMFVQPNDEKFRANKKFAMACLRSNYGAGNKSIEGRILAEVYKVADFLSELNGTPTELSNTVKHAVARVISSIVYSSSYKLNDPEVDRLIELTHRFLEVNFSEDLNNAYQLPAWMRKIFCGKAVQNARRLDEDVKQFVMEKVNEHRQVLDGSNPRDVMDQYLIERDGPSVDESLLAFTLFTFMVDATQSLSAVVMTGLLQIVSNPEIQARIQDELDKVVGRSGEPKLAHKAETMYLHAVTLESLRVSDPVPLGADRRPLKKTTLAGFDIPQDCIVYASLHSVHMDPDIFPEPEVFKPEHFLDGKGNLINTEYCIPFSIGRRMCIGEQLVKMELYLFYAALLHKFVFKFASGKDEKVEEQDYVSYVLLTPKPREICALPR